MFIRGKRKEIVNFNCNVCAYQNDVNTDTGSNNRNIIHIFVRRMPLLMSLCLMKKTDTTIKV